MTAPPTHTPVTTLRAALIGTGKISEEHLKFLRDGPLARTAGVCDLSPSLAKYAVERFGAGRAFTDYGRMLRDVRPDVVHVLTPPHTHVQIVGDCLGAGAHVIVEKPVAPTRTEFRQLWDLAQSRNLRLVEDHNYRFNEPVLEIERMVARGALGDVREAEVRMALGIRKPGGRYADENLPHPSHGMPAGVIHEFLTHLCYLLLRFVPLWRDADSAGPPRIAAAWSNHGGGPLFKYDDLDALVVAGPVHGRIRFTSHAAPDCFTVTVRGTRGWVETDLFQPHLRVVVPRPGGAQLSPLVNQLANGAGLMKAGVSGFRNKVLQKTPYEGLRTFLGVTYEAIAGGTEPPVTFEDMDGASRLVDALLDEANCV